jgi:WhiB family transcriptional regulator, redox-sensing transcriptional regulator
VTIRGPFLEEKARGSLETRAFAKAWVSAEAGGRRLPCTLAGDFWTSDSQADRDYAVQLCLPCPIRTACLVAARARGEVFAVWGAEDFTSAASGVHIRKRKAAA